MLDDINAFFFDLDKTLWEWDSNLIGAEDTIDYLRKKDRQVFFHTDNTLLTREGYAKKLTSAGIPAEKEDIITSGYVAGKVLAEKNVTKAYVIGESGLIEELEQEDVQFSEDAEAVVIGLDRQFSYNKLKRAMKLTEKGRDVYICSTEDSFRTSKGLQPHQGPINAAIQRFTDTKLVGKPSEAYRDVFEEYFSFFPNRSIFIGDRLEDIETGNRLGMETVAVMSGDLNKKKLAGAEDIQEPDYGLSNLTRLRKRII